MLSLEAGTCTDSCILYVLHLVVCCCRCCRFIASGAFGDVFLARWHGTEVAVKCLSSNLLAGNSEGGSSAAGSAAAADLMQEASMLAALHHPNIVAVYGFVPPPQDMLGRCSFELPAQPPIRTVSASAASQCGSREVCGPAIVSEYMAAGSLHNALQNQAEWLKSSMAKVKVLLDTARVGVSFSSAF
jgi:serine/threonine protein kinase